MVFYCKYNEIAFCLEKTKILVQNIYMRTCIVAGLNVLAIVSPLQKEFFVIVSCSVLFSCVFCSFILQIHRIFHAFTFLCGSIKLFDATRLITKFVTVNSN